MTDLSKNWTRRCHRCGKEVSSHTLSKFNTDLICLGCAEEERWRSDYDKAVEAITIAINQGDFDFPGIGWTEKPNTIKPDDRPANIFGD